MPCLQCLLHHIRMVSEWRMIVVNVHFVFHRFWWLLERHTAPSLAMHRWHLIWILMQLGTTTQSADTHTLEHTNIPAAHIFISLEWTKANGFDWDCGSHLVEPFPVWFRVDSGPLILDTHILFVVLQCVCCVDIPIRTWHVYYTSTSILYLYQHYKRAIGSKLDRLTPLNAHLPIIDYPLSLSLSLSLSFSFAFSPTVLEWPDNDHHINIQCFHRHFSPSFYISLFPLKLMRVNIHHHLCVCVCEDATHYRLSIVNTSPKQFVISFYFISVGSIWPLASNSFPALFPWTFVPVCV